MADRELLFRVDSISETTGSFAPLRFRVSFITIVSYYVQYPSKREDNTGCVAVLHPLLAVARSR
jgi:hypothetical protein